MDGQSGVEIRNSILDAMENLISSNKKSSSFDKMFLGRIKSVKGVNLYDVVINGKLYTNVQGIKSFEVNINDIVFCIAPQNNINMLRVLFSLSKDLKNIEEIKKEISNNAKAIISKQDKLTFDTEPTENSTNPVTSNGIYQRTRPYMERVANNASWNQTSHTHTTGVVDPSLGFPRFLVFSSKAKSSPNNEQSMRMYPVEFLKYFDAVEMDCRDAWAGFKDIKLTYTDNKYTLHFNIRGQSGWSDVNTLNIYLVW